MKRLGRVNHEGAVPSAARNVQNPAAGQGIPSLTIREKSRRSVRAMQSEENTASPFSPPQP